jgi:CRP-like cAMP-binding protein
MELRSVISALGKSALFGSLADSECVAVAGRMRRVIYEPDQMIFSRGDPGRDIYLVIDGRVRLSVLTADGRELSFAHARPGDIFGEIAALDGGERTAGATAITPVEAMTLSQMATVEVIENNPKVARAAIDFLCSRLRETDHRLRPSRCTVSRCVWPDCYSPRSGSSHQTPRDRTFRSRLAFRKAKWPCPLEPADLRSMRPCDFFRTWEQSLAKETS